MNTSWKLIALCEAVAFLTIFGMVVYGAIFEAATGRRLSDSIRSCFGVVLCASTLIGVFTGLLAVVLAFIGK